MKLCTTIDATLCKKQRVVQRVKRKVSDNPLQHPLHVVSNRTYLWKHRSRIAFFVEGNNMRKQGRNMGIVYGGGSTASVSAPSQICKGSENVPTKKETTKET
jgi:hypothetical protein